MVEVSDGRSEPPLLAKQSADAPSGRGIVIVEGMSNRWGWHPRPGGKIVWAEVPVDGRVHRFEDKGSE